MENTWQKNTSLPPGGFISGISADLSGNLWLSSPAGVFTGKGGVFTHQLRGIPFSSASTILALGKMILVAGFPNHILRSPDSGRTWFSTWADQVTSPVNCFSASPNFRSDSVVLAGTDGDGILRSTNAGKSWQLANFGLRSFNILDLVTAPSWDRYEIVFAATESGVYQSPNGGRAWRSASEGLPDVAVLSLAISPDFIRGPGAITGAVFAGTEGCGLYRSDDLGISWRALPGFLFQQDTINALLFDADGTLFAGTAEEILATTDLGESWQTVCKVEDPVLRLAAHGTRLMAGTAGSGLLASEDHGRTWQPILDGSFRRFTQIAARTPGYRSTNLHEPDMVLAGPVDGIWLKTASPWQRLASWPADQPVIALQSLHDRFLAITPNLLLAAQDPGRAWEKLFESPTRLSTLACIGGELFLASQAGELWRSVDAGKTWQSIPADIRGARILALELSPGYLHDRTIFVATRAAAEARVALWRVERDGAAWKSMFEEPTLWQNAILSVADAREPIVYMAAGTDLFTLDSSGWKRRAVAPPEAPVTALLALGDLNSVLLAAHGVLLLSRDKGATWEDGGIKNHTIIALIKAPDSHPAHRILALTSDGAIYARDF